MGRPLKLTAMELGALSVLTLVVAAIAITFSVNGCNKPTFEPQTEMRTDSITANIEAAMSKGSDSSKVAPLKKQKKSQTRHSGVKTVPRQPIERNYLDEPANE